MSISVSSAYVSLDIPFHPSLTVYSLSWVTWRNSDVGRNPRILCLVQWRSLEGLRIGIRVTRLGNLVWKREYVL